ncbi:unnamed protein product [Eruca vesicaria subsp. sativa]|uniref:Uncharacterized protein n=1 Tax=Eruca vesicaria subsp. sativa TaxID=29727 RepID=A0ABC8KHV9_ERUVS|nr:unnamed protein product [Eruca vesicaria subsp. sativa]
MCMIGLLWFRDTELLLSSGCVTSLTFGVASLLDLADYLSSMEILLMDEGSIPDIGFLNITIWVPLKVENWK